MEKEEKQRLDLPDEVKVGALLDLPIKVEIGVQDDFEMTCGKDAVSRLDLPDEVEVGALLDLPEWLRSESRESGPQELMLQKKSPSGSPYLWLRSEACWISPLGSRSQSS